MSTAPNANPKPTDWHRRPAGFAGPCPVCGCPDPGGAEHRAVDQAEALDALYITRRKSRRGWSHRAIGSRAQAAAPKPRPVGREASPQTLALIGQATILVAQGKTIVQIAAALDTTIDKLAYCLRWHPTLWKTALDKAQQQIIAIVRAQAGTPAVLVDPDAFCELGSLAHEYAAADDEPLFPPHGKTTLVTFFETYYRPKCMIDVTEGVVKLYRIILRRWALVTGDPPLADITSDTQQLFRDFLMKSRGLRRTVRMSRHTIQHYMRHVQTILDKAGPRGKGNRDGAALIAEVPYIRPPKAPRKIPKIVPLEHLEAAYLAAACMDFPRLPGIKPPAWWQALLVVAYNTQFRKRTLLEIRMDDIDWPNRRIVVPAERLKSGRPMIQPLNATALEHLRGIRTARELVFPWPKSPRQFWPHFHKLLQFAAIPWKEHFGLHAIRRTAATILWAHSPQAAQLALGHMDLATTQEHYVNGTAIVATALDSMPQPPAFSSKAAT